jgi:hypothetical protein
MAIELDKRRLRSYEIEKQKKKRIKVFVVVFVILLVSVIAVFALRYILQKNFTGYEVINTMKREDSTSAKYTSYQGGVLRYSRDGAMAMDAAGNMLWNGTYQMKNPIVDISKKYVAIADRGYRTVEIFDGEGGVNTVKVLNPIIDVKIANQGVIAVLMEGKETNYIYLYDKTGNKLADKRTVASTNGFPIDIALSEDGRKLVTSYAAINSGEVQCKLTFYNFGKVGESHVDKMTGAFDYGKTIIANIEFLDNDTICAFGDDKFSIYSMKEIPKLVYEETVPSEIKSILYNSQYVGFVLKNSEGEQKYKVVLYDLKGTKVLDKDMNYNYENIYLSGNQIIMHTNLEWIIWETDGKEILRYTFDKNVTYILPGPSERKFIIINDQNMDEIQLVEK